MSSALTEIVDYILAKIQGVNVNNPKANAGAKYVRNNYHDEDIPRLVDISFQIIQSHFTKSSSEAEAGEARLTTVSSGIGSKVVPNDPDMGIYTQWETEIRVGDLFVEAYYNCGFVDLYYPRMRNSFHIIPASNKWTLVGEIPDETIKHNLKGTVTKNQTHPTCLLYTSPSPRDS